MIIKKKISEEKKDQPPFNQLGGEDLSSPQKFTDKKSQRGWGKVLRDVNITTPHV
ncbi:MAG: hypothetical protein HXS53_05400 [Theionarchaea archaeon]|nr:hypothetical protein [Theionarchaea archaeon]